MRKITPEVGEYYHIYNRSHDKKSMFLDRKDWIRFLFVTLHLQSPEIFHNMNRYVTKYVKYSVFNIDEEKIERIPQKRYVDLVSFAIMPNHFHFLLSEITEGGISRYMQRVQEAYSKYFNTKYNKSGHLFQGPYQAVRVRDNKQLLHLSAYIHRNPRELKRWRNKEHTFPWSSYQDYGKENRWGKLLQHDIITGQFHDYASYRKFVGTSREKELLDESHVILE